MTSATGTIAGPSGGGPGTLVVWLAPAGHTEPRDPFELHETWGSQIPLKSPNP